MSAKYDHFVEENEVTDLFSNLGRDTASLKFLIPFFLITFGKGLDISSS